MYVIIDNEAGNTIEHAETIEQAQQIIAEYEAADKKDGTYTPNFYAIKYKPTKENYNGTDFYDYH